MKGILFDDIHSYNDLNLVLSKVDIPPAEAKETYVDVPGSDGSVDLTEALGEVKYKDRKCSFTFTVFPYDDFEEKKKEVSNLLNGKRCKITLDKDSGYYWAGRCSVNKYESNKNLHKIVITAIVAPYKLKLHQTVVTVPAGKSVTVTLQNGRKTVAPIITNTEEASITFGGTARTISPGSHVLLDIILKYGANQLSVTSNASVKFTYQEGDL